MCDCRYRRLWCSTGSPSSSGRSSRWSRVCRSEYRGWPSRRAHASTCCGESVSRRPGKASSKALPTNAGVASPGDSGRWRMADSGSTDTRSAASCSMSRRTTRAVCGNSCPNTYPTGASPAHFGLDVNGCIRKVRVCAGDAPRPVPGLFQHIHMLETAVSNICICWKCAPAQGWPQAPPSPILQHIDMLETAVSNILARGGSKSNRAPISNMWICGKTERD